MTSAPKGNPALRMLGLPHLPRKLPSRNWLTFWTVFTTVTAAIIYDGREKRRATARWARAVEHLAREPLPAGQPLAMPRKLTIYLASPPGDGLRVSQDWFTEYVKPVLAASGLDWDFVQGRQQGDVRAVVAERIRKARRRSGVEPEANPDRDEELLTEDERRHVIRRSNGIPDYDGVGGDVVIGRHTWKEYVRGLHEGWLGPLRPRLQLEPHVPAHMNEKEKQPEEAASDKEKKPRRPPQIPAYNSPDDYAAAALPLLAPADLGPAVPIPQQHVLGFTNTPTRMLWFFNRRKMANEIGREVASACLATYRDFNQSTDADVDTLSRWEQQTALQPEEKNWLKSVWQDELKDVSGDADPKAEPANPPKDRTWGAPVVVDPRIGMRMRRFELNAADKAHAEQIVIPESAIEGWIKRSLRKLYHWTAAQFSDKPKGPNVGDLSDD
ncbi:hypothetical protein P8C59_006043 [Phyllachora maydis]|uniref:Mitochondrial import inner membrane translocase subunit TIM54 n=1 Tax=Phyllachora maydis TaxID=1825666 RepID=A0AAD9I7D8_9PEZI|nr:hypothetical protein P8C59_006043 [Phyllachora maydis]